LQSVHERSATPKHLDVLSDTAGAVSEFVEKTLAILKGSFLDHLVEQLRAGDGQGEESRPPTSISRPATARTLSRLWSVDAHAQDRFDLRP